MTYDEILLLAVAIVIFSSAMIDWVLFIGVTMIARNDV